MGGNPGQTKNAHVHTLVHATYAHMWCMQRMLKLLALGTPLLSTDSSAATEELAHKHTDTHVCIQTITHTRTSHLQLPHQPVNSLVLIPLFIRAIAQVRGDGLHGLSVTRGLLCVCEYVCG